jgi:hypothetical protein
MAIVAIVDYDPTWPDQVEELAAGLRGQLADGALGIDHIGSTAVPGLAAKDVIDLQVTVSDLAQADRLGPAFERAGYVATAYRRDHRPAGDTSDPGRWEKRLWQRPPGERPCPGGRLAQPALRAAVPRLPAGPSGCRRRVCAAQAALAERLGDDLAAHTKVKDHACDLIAVAAEDWARRGSHPASHLRAMPSPGPSS